MSITPTIRWKIMPFESDSAVITGNTSNFSSNDTISVWLRSLSRMTSFWIKTARCQHIQFVWMVQAWPRQTPRLQQPTKLVNISTTSPCHQLWKYCRVLIREVEGATWFFLKQKWKISGDYLFKGTMPGKAFTYGIFLKPFLFVSKTDISLSLNPCRW